CHLYLSPYWPCLPHYWNIPPLRCGNAAVVTHDTQRRRIEQKTGAICNMKSDPPRRKGSEQVAMREQSHIAVNGADFSNDAIDSGFNLIGAFTTRATVCKNHPAGVLGVNLLGG